MDTALGLVGLVLFIMCVIALAAAITWTVVKITPDKAARKSRQAG